MKKTGKILAITFAITLILNAIVLVGQAGLIGMKFNSQQQSQQMVPQQQITLLRGFLFNN